MADYIKREAIDFPWLESGKIINGELYVRLDEIYAEIRKFPAADVVPVVHAKWIYHDDDNTCSACGKTVTEHNDLGKKQWFPLCPYCGAKMDL